MANVNNLVRGPATIYWAPFGSTEPVDTVAQLALAPSAPWVDLGYTTGGVTFTPMQEITDYEADQLYYAPGASQTMGGLEVKFSVLETTLDNLKFALNGGTVTESTGTGGTATSRSYDPAVVAATAAPNFSALIIDGFWGTKTTGLLRRRMIVRRVLSTENIDDVQSKTDQNKFDVTLRSYYVSDSIKPWTRRDEPRAV